MVYHERDDFTLLQGDCLEVLETIQEGSIDMVFADPPYNLSNGGITCQSGRMVKVDKASWDVSKGITKDFEFHKLWLEKCHRVLRPSGTLWVSGTYHSIYGCGHALQLLGYVILNDIIWFKPNAAPNLSRRCFAASHETLIWAKKAKSEKHVFNYDIMKKYNDSSDLFKNRDKQMRSVWSIPPPSAKEKTCGKHPTQKPIALLERIVRASTQPGDTVLDPFCGSCTTGVAARKLARKFIGIEMEQSYLDISVRRCDALDLEMRQATLGMNVEE